MWHYRTLGRGIAAAQAPPDRPSRYEEDDDRFRPFRRTEPVASHGSPRRSVTRFMGKSLPGCGMPSMPRAEPGASFFRRIRRHRLAARIRQRRRRKGAEQLPADDRAGPFSRSRRCTDEPSGYSRSRAFPALRRRLLPRSARQIRVEALSRLAGISLRGIRWRIVAEFAVGLNCADRGRGPEGCGRACPYRRVGYLTKAQFAKRMHDPLSVDRQGMARPAFKGHREI